VSTLSTLFLLVFFVISANARVKIAVFDSPLTHSHAQKIHQFLKEKLKSCHCTYVHHAIYNTSGTIDLEAFLKGLKSIDESYQIVHLSWNLPYSSKFDAIIKELNRIADQGIRVVAASGESQERSEIALALHDTVMGKVRNAILVGELDKKGKLPLNAFFGPEMKARYPSVPGKPGSSFTAVLETAKIALSLKPSR